MSFIYIISIFIILYIDLFYQRFIILIEYDYILLIYREAFIIVRYEYPE